jgi:hypothetical protein
LRKTPLSVFIEMMSSSSMSAVRLEFHRHWRRFQLLVLC